MFVAFESACATRAQVADSEGGAGGAGGSGGGGSYTLTLQNINGSAGTFNKISGTYDDTSSTKNIIQFKFISTSEAWYTISKIGS